jgi:hypothetical protein
VSDERSALSAAVADAFGSPDEAELASRYVDAVRENIRDAQSHQGRVSTMLVLSVLAFFLLLETDTGGLSFAGITIKDASLPTQLLPALIAYLLYNIFDTGHYVLRMRTVLREVLKITHEAVIQGRLDRYVVPRSTVFPLSEIAEYLSEDAPKNPTMRRGVVMGYVGIVLVTMCACCAFIAYCYVQLALRFGVEDVLYWISLAIAAIYLGRAALAPATREAVAFLLLNLARSRSGPENHTVKERGGE